MECVHKRASLARTSEAKIIINWLIEPILYIFKYTQLSLWSSGPLILALRMDSWDFGTEFEGALMLGLDDHRDALVMFTENGKSRKQSPAHFGATKLFARSCTCFASERHVCTRLRTLNSLVARASRVSRPRCCEGISWPLSPCYGCFSLASMVLPNIFTSARLIERLFHCVKTA